MRPSIYQVKQLGAGQLSVMAKPVSGEYIEDEFSAIAKEGINLVVSLLEKHEEYSVGLSCEEELCNKNAIEFLSFPIPDRGLPESIRSFSALTKGLYSQINSGTNVVVHCRAGIGRTGIVSAGILLHSGMSSDAAFQLISERRGVEVPDTEEQKAWVSSNYHEITTCT